MCGRILDFASRRAYIAAISSLLHVRCEWRAVLSAPPGPTCLTSLACPSNQQAPYVVTEMESGGPAEQQGAMRVGDAVHQVDDAPVSGLEISRVAALVRGSPGSTVELTLSRPDQQASAHDLARPRAVAAAVVHHGGAALPHGVQPGAEVEKTSRAAQDAAQGSERSALGHEAAAAAGASAEARGEPAPHSSVGSRHVFEIDLQRGKPASDGMRRANRQMLDYIEHRMLEQRLGPSDMTLGVVRCHVLSCNVRPFK